MLALLLAACDSEPEVATLEVTVTASELFPTVAHVTWHTDTPGLGWVVYGRTASEELETHHETTLTTEHDIIVAGLTSGEAWQLQTHVSVEDEEFVADPEAFTPGALTATDVEVGEVTGALQSARWLVQATLGDGEGTAIFDNDGTIVWANAEDHGRTSGRTRLSLDGTTLLVADFNVDSQPASFGSIERIVLDGTRLDPIPTPTAHHDFALTPDGYAYLQLDAREIGGQSVVGDTIVEVDEAGNELARPWSAFDTWSAAGATEPEHFYGQGIDWTHSNTLEYDATKDEYLVSVRNQSTVLRIARGTGEVVEQIGGNESTYSLSAGTAFEGQHSPFFPSSDTLLVFDNGVGNVSAVREYHLDDVGHTYAETWHSDNPSNTNIPVLGDVYRATSGSTLAVWSLSGVLQELAPSGEESFRLDLSLGSAFAFMEPVNQLGGPSPY